MPSVSKAQKKLFAIAAKDPEFAESHHIDQKLAKEWHNADKAKEAAGEDKDLPEHVKKKE
jgi:hypothetical protein